MKIKILLMPLMLIGIIYLAIWVAVPSYSDPEGIVDMKARLAASNDKLNDINMRISNAGKLIDELSQNSSDQKLLVHYLPEKKLNEDVVASLNSIASASGVALTSLSFKDIQDEVPPVDVNLGMTMGSGIETNRSMDSPKNVEPQKSFSKNFAADLVVVGDYEKIRSFILSLSTFKRFNGIESLSISKKENANFLEANLSVRFNYLKKTASISIIDKEMFKKPSFDMSVAGEITNKTSINITKPNVDSAGRVNPFAL